MDMVERLLSRAVDQVPALVVLAILCLIFLRGQKAALVALTAQFTGALEAERKTFVAALDHRDSMHEATCQDCHRVGEAATAAIVEGSRVMGTVEAGLRETRTVLRQVGSVVERCERRPT